LTTPDLRHDAESETERLLNVRRHVARARGVTEEAIAVPVTRLCGTHLRRHAGLGRGPCLIWLFTVRIADSAGRFLERRLIPLTVPVGGAAPLRTASDVARLARTLTARFLSLLSEKARASCEPRRAEIARLYEPALRRAAQRESTINRALDERPSLFDGRALTIRTRERHQLAATTIERETQVERLHAAQTVEFAGPPECCLVLVVDGR
jgi:hypothetical protein